MPLRPGTTGRVLPFPASLVRDDPRIDAYVDLKTVPSLPDLGNIPLVPEVENLAPGPTAAASKLSTSRLSTIRSHSRVDISNDSRNNSVLALGRRVSNLQTGGSTIGSEQTPLSGKLEDVALAAVVAKAAEPVHKFPYKIPDLFMNMIRRKRQLEMEAKHPERGHTRVLLANYSRPVYRKAEPPHQVSALVEGGDNDAVSVATSMGRKGDKGSKKRYSFAAKNSTTGKASVTERTSAKASNGNNISPSKGKSLSRPSIDNSNSLAGSSFLGTGTTSLKKNGSSLNIALSNSNMSRSKSIVKMDNMRRPSMNPQQLKQIQNHRNSYTVTSTPSTNALSTIPSTAATVPSLVVGSTSSLTRLTINTSRPGSSGNLMTIFRQGSINATPSPFRFQQPSRYNYRTTTSPYSYQQNTTTATTPGGGKRVRIQNIPNPDTPFRKLQTQELDTLHNLLISLGETNIPRELLSRAFYIPMEIAKPSINVSQVLKTHGLTRNVVHRRIRTPAVDEEDDEIDEEVYQHFFGGKSKRGKGLLPIHKVAVFPKTAPIVLDDEDGAEPSLPKTDSWWTAAEYRDLRTGWEVRKMKRVQELLAVEQGKRMSKDPFNSFVKGRAATPSKNTKHNHRFDAIPSQSEEGGTETSVNWFPTVSRRSRKVSTTRSFAVSESLRGDSRNSAYPDFVFGGDGVSRSTTPGPSLRPSEVMHVQQSYSKYKPGVL
ncbi:hypothetical protein BDR26DRAFT_854020 [Obelidium mucronatum]|nr:hypothetical protein BDR26DRAFT_854020 [Obelidium mucronatum]